jgi:hypothetical protein
MGAAGSQAIVRRTLCWHSLMRVLSVVALVMKGEKEL